MSQFEFHAETMHVDSNANEAIIAAALIQTLGSGAVLALVDKNIKRIARLSVDVVEAIVAEKAKRGEKLVDEDPNYGV